MVDFITMSVKMGICCYKATTWMSLINKHNVEQKKPDTKSTYVMIPFIYCFKTDGTNLW